MAKTASYRFFFIFLCLFFRSSSGTLVGFSYHARGNNKAMAFLKQYKVSASQIRVFVSDPKSLSYLSKTGLSLDVYLSKYQLHNLKPHVSIKTVVVANDVDRTGLDGLSRLLPTLKSLHSVLTRFGIEKQVKVSVALPWPLLVNNKNNMSAKHEKHLCRVLSYVKKVKSFVIIEQMPKMDYFLTPTFPCNDVIPLVLTFKNPGLENLSEFTRRLSKSLQNSPRSNIAGLYVELGPNFARRELLTRPEYETTQYDTIYPATPITNTPTTPAIVMVNPSPVTITNPATATPIVTLPLTGPPVTTAPITVPGAQPITNPVTTYPVPVTTPVTANPVAPPASYIPGQTWCVARTGVPETQLQAALDYACGGGADCSQIQQSGSCYNPNTLQGHASYAFNDYFQRSQLTTSCDFGGTAAMINSNPSTGLCIYPTSASSASPLTMTPITPTPITPTPTIPTPTPTIPTPTTTIPTPTPTVPTPTPVITNPTTVPTPTWSTVPGSSSTPPPSLLNTSTGTGSEFGVDSPPGYSNSSASNSLRPLLGFVLLLTSLVLRNIVLV